MGGIAIAPEITFETGEGGNGNPLDKMFIKGQDWDEGETIAADSITVAGQATTHKAVTVDSNEEFGPLLVTITDAITTVGEKDIIVEGSATGITTFADYWMVSQGAGLNDMYKFADLRNEELDKDVMLMAIVSALSEYYGEVYSFISLTNDVHTVGAYPEVSRTIISLMAAAILYTSYTGTDDGMKKAEGYRKEADRLIEKIQLRQTYLQNPDGTYVAFRDSSQQELVNKTGSFGVVDSYDEEVFDN